MIGWVGAAGEQASRVNTRGDGKREADERDTPRLTRAPVLADLEDARSEGFREAAERRTSSNHKKKDTTVHSPFEQITASQAHESIQGPACVSTSVWGVCGT